LKLQVQIAVFSGYLLGVDQFELIVLYLLLHEQRVEPHSLAVLLRCQPLVHVLLNLNFHLLLHFISNLLSLVDTKLDDLQGVPNEIVLDFAIDGGVRRKRGRVVDFQHPRLQLVVEHDVEAEQFEANVWLLRLATPVDVL